MTNGGGQRLAPVFIDDVARLVADSARDPAAAGQVFELGGPDVLPMREIDPDRAAPCRRGDGHVLPGPTTLLKLVAAPMALLPSPPLTPDAIDFINQPATVDIGPLLERMPRRLTRLEEGLSSYLTPESSPGALDVRVLTARSPPLERQRAPAVDAVRDVPALTQSGRRR